MSRKRMPSEETRFLRGEIGVDGAAAEEEKDLAEVERGKAREQFLRGKAYLGREFLTWLLWSSESGEPLLSWDDEPLTVLLTDRLVLRGIAGDVVEMSVRGAMAPYSPIVRQALDRGLLIHSARMQFVHGERRYHLGLDAEHLDIKGAKLPALLSEEEDDKIRERLFLTDQLSGLLQALLEHFLRLRASKAWMAEVVPAMKEWMAPEEEAVPTRKAS